MCFRITRCCCFSNTKDGSFAVGVYTSFLSVISIILPAVSLSQLEYFFGKYNKHDEDVASDFAANALRINFIVLLVFGVICLLISFLLLYGVKKDDRLYFIPWMIWMALVITGQIVVFILLFIAIFVFHALLAIGMVFVGLYTAFNIYCYGCVYSQYKSLIETPYVEMQMEKV